MLYQLRFSAAIHRTALVLLLVCVSSMLGMAGPRNISLIPKGEPQVATFVEEEPATVAQQKPSPSPTSTPRPNVSLAPAKTQQSEQGQKYGEPGFVGEPINLNVVNADIRDILN